jgi:hypothetical protein
MTDQPLTRPLTQFPAGSQGQSARTTPDPRLLGLLAQLAAASTTAEIADAAVAHAVALLGGRAGALGLLSPGASRIEIVGSVGYGCGTMSAGSSLPADAGLPITRAATTGMTVVAGDVWIAAPLAFGASPLGALLVSLAAPSDRPDVAAALVEEVAVHTRAALARLPRRPTPPSVIHTHLRAGEVAADVRLQPVNDASGGDVVELWSAGDGSCWLLIADACGADAVAATTAFAVAVTARAISAGASGPGALLTALDDALGRTSRADRFVTALAARIRPTGAGLLVTMATAGHPGPYVLGGATVVGADLIPESPLNLRLGHPFAPAEASFTLGMAERLLFYTDGALDRVNGTLSENVLAAILAGIAVDTAAQSALSAVSDALEAAGGPRRDDMALAMVGRADRPTP